MGNIFTSELKEGMLTTEDAYSAEGRLVLSKDTVITKSIINKLISNNVLFVTVSDDTKVEKEKSDDDIDLSNLTEYEDPITKTPEFRKFRRRYESNLENLSDSLNDIVHKNATVDIDEMLEGPMDILKSSDSPLGVFNMMSSMKSYDDSTFNHSMNVALICNIIATWLELPESDVNIVTACGLLHDIGKLLIPDEIIKKPGKLTDEEYAIVKTHTQKGFEILNKRKTDMHIQYAALMHHEKCDGTGYPLGIKSDQIDWCAQIVTIADIYDAMTSDRVYRGALNPFKVINFFENDGLSKYNPKYLMTFFEHVVNSYLNCKVVLSNGEEGDIVYINKVNLSRPMVKTENSFIDLSTQTNISIDKLL